MTRVDIPKRAQGPASRYEGGVIADSMWEGFAQAIVRVELTDGPVVLVPRGEGVGEFPFHGPVHIITAYNPAGVQTHDATNRERHRELEHRVTPYDVLPTVGSDPGGSMPEPGYALLDVSLDTAVEIGHEFEQRAIYRWTHESLSIIGVDEPIRLHLGWSLSPT